MPASFQGRPPGSWLLGIKAALAPSPSLAKPPTGNTICGSAGFALSMLSVTAWPSSSVPGFWSYRTFASKSEAIKAVGRTAPYWRGSACGRLSGAVSRRAVPGCPTRPARADCKGRASGGNRFRQRPDGGLALGDGATIVEGLSQAANKLGDVRAATDRAGRAMSAAVRRGQGFFCRAWARWSRSSNHS